MTGGFSSVSISMTADMKDKLDRLASALGIDRSKAARRLIESSFGDSIKTDAHAGQNGAQNTDVSGKACMAKLRDHMAGVLGAVSAPDGGYPAMGLDAYNLALVLTELHAASIRAGTIPMVRDDAEAADLDPDGRYTWDTYMDTLPDFFGVLLGTDNRPSVNVRYETLDAIDGQGSGGIEGVVESYKDAYPDAYPDGGTARYVKMRVRTIRQSVEVLVPSGCGADGVTVGIPVYAAGTFEVRRERVVVRARKCIVRRIPKFDDVYAVADEWNVPNEVAGEAVMMLRNKYGTRAPKFSAPFAAYLRADRNTAPRGYALRLPSGRTIWLGKDKMRDTPDGVDAFRWCTEHWADVMGG